MSLGQQTQEFMNEPWEPDNPETVPHPTVSTRTATTTAHDNITATTTAHDNTTATTSAHDHTTATKSAPDPTIASTSAYPSGPSNHSEFGDATQAFLNDTWQPDEHEFGDDTQALLNDTWDPDVHSEFGSELGDYSQAFVNELWAEQEGGALADHFAISMLFEQAVPGLNTIGRAFRMTFHDLENIGNLHELFYSALEQLIEQAFQEATDQDLVGAEIRHPGLTSPIQIPFRPRIDLDVDTIWNMILSVLQSNVDFNLDEAVTIQTTIIGALGGAGPGGGPRYKTRYHMEDWIEERMKNRSCVIRMENKDNLCLARAIVTGIAKHESILNSGNKAAWNNWLNVNRGDKGRRTAQRVKAKALMDKAGLGSHKGLCGHAELDSLQAELSPLYRLRVVHAEQMLTVTYDGGDTGQYINLLLHNQHYHLILSMPAFYQTSYFCDYCKTGYSHMTEHTECQHRCRCCFGKEPCERQGHMLYCGDCRRWFLSEQCLSNHKIVRVQNVSKEGETVTTENSVCQNVSRCEGCGKTLYGRKKQDQKHECGSSECKFCKEMVDPSEHLCFMQPILAEKDKDKAPQSLLFFDFETTQDQTMGSNAEGLILRHVVNCVSSSKSCQLCAGTDGNFCKNCGVRRHMFLGKTSLDDFCKYLFSRENKDVIAMAHNNSGYDGQFVLDYLQRQALVPKMIARGLSIVRLEAAKVILLDSMSFLPMSLAALTRAFGIPESKGYFPHLFNTMANWNYEGPIPDAWFYGPGTMKPPEREQFYQWYNAQSKTEPWKLQEQLVHYCKLDVCILEKGCLKFRQLMLELFAVDPFAVASTIPGTAMYVFRKMFMELESIGIVPFGGYRKNDKHSVIAIKWLKWVSEKQSVSIQHAENGKEIRIGRWKVDGQDRYDKSQLYEFYGCAYHGCPKCFPNRSNRLPKSDVTAAEAYQSTMDRQRDLEQQKYRVCSIWECDLRRRLKTDPEMALFFKSIELYDPLDPRDAFFGGRTNATRLHHKVTGTEKIFYGDICSLYPFICKYCAFPRGHPTIITENFKPIDTDNKHYKGLIKCLVLPPRKLYHPVLPMRSAGKLTFPLCFTCTEERNQDECTHADHDRAIWGTWTHVELYHAIDRGYVVLKTAEVYHYDEWSQYDKKDDKTGLFTAYINAFLKIKQQASGWPSWAETEEQKHDYIKQYMDKENIELEWDKIEKNPALRSLAKLLLNSFWGKFGQRCKLAKTEFFSEPQPYYQVVFNAANEILSVRIVNTQMVAVGYRKSDDYVEEQQYTNPIIAAFVTANARLKLLSYLEPLGNNCLYYDTDSVIFVHDKDEYRPTYGDFLGDLTDELGGDHITEFCSGGPKVYGFKTSKGSTVVKIRGVTLNSTTSNRLNFRSLNAQVQQFIRDGDRGRTDIVMNRIVRTAERVVQTRTLRKQYKVTYDKRRVLANGDTVPYGY